MDVEGRRGVLSLRILLSTVLAAPTIPRQQAQPTTGWGLNNCFPRETLSSNEVGRLSCGVRAFVDVRGGGGATVGAFLRGRRLLIGVARGTFRWTQLGAGCEPAGWVD